MGFVLQNLLATIGITAVVFVEHYSYRELSAVCYKYIQNGKYFKVTSFYTAAWIGPSPFGPTLSKTGELLANCIEDVAMVEEFATLKDLKRSPPVTEKELQNWYNAVDNAAMEKMEQLFAEYREYVIQATFTFLPIPCTVVALSKRQRYLGSVSVSSYGEVMVLTHTSDEIFTIVDNIQTKTLPSGDEVII